MTDRNTRQAAAKFAVAVDAIEGVGLSGYARKILDDWTDGKLDMSKALDMLRKHHAQDIPKKLIEIRQLRPLHRPRTKIQTALRPYTERG